MSQNIKDSIKQKISEDISPTKNLSGFHLKIVMGIAIIWTFISTLVCFSISVLV